MANNSGHALLGPSSSKMWLNCTPSARLNESIEESASIFAEEGTDAHSLCEYKLLKAIGVPVDENPPHLEYYSQEMEDCANEYVAFVLEKLEEAKKICKDPMVLVEQYLNLSKYVPESFGTGDNIIASDGILFITDYKHGKGVQVEAEHNTQMMLYALGALEIFDGIYDIEKVSMTIFQPRLANVSTWEITVDELYKWANEVLIPRAEIAFKGEGQFSCGEWCKFCKSKKNCRERANFNLSMASSDFAEPPLLTDEEISEILGRIDGLVNWVNDIKEYAMNEALKGKKWPGYKLVAGKANRKYSNDDDVAKTVIDAGFDPYEKKLLSITEMQKRLGKEKFEELLSKFVVKPIGKPTLVISSDKRAELVINTAQEDFKNIDKTEEN